MTLVLIGFKRNPNFFGRPQLIPFLNYAVRKPWNPAVRGGVPVGFLTREAGCDRVAYVKWIIKCFLWSPTKMSQITKNTGRLKVLCINTVYSIFLLMKCHIWYTIGERFTFQILCCGIRICYILMI